MAAPIPENVDPSGTYLLSGSLLNSILDALRESKIVIEDDSGPLQIKERGPQGTVLGLNTDTCPS
jgi:hypothetical protein